MLAKLKEVGEIAVPGGFAGSGELIRMANLDDLRAEVDVNESDLAKVQLGPARRGRRPTPIPTAAMRARVVKLYPQINRQKGTLKVEVRILEPDEWLRPDMSVRVTFLAGEPAARRGERRAGARAARGGAPRRRGRVRLGRDRGPPAPAAARDHGRGGRRTRRGEPAGSPAARRWSWATPPISARGSASDANAQTQ